jgi:hypothetical protein
MEVDIRRVDMAVESPVAHLELCDFVLSQPELFEVNECLQVFDCLQTVG